MSMLTYQLQKRRLHATGSCTEASLPNIVEIEISLEPSNMFGVREYPDSVTPTDNFTKILVNMSTGKISSTPALFPSVETSAELVGKDLQIDMNGNKLCVRRRCVDLQDLDDFFFMFNFMLPILFAVEFTEAPFVTATKGRIDGASFSWILNKPLGTFSITNKERQEQIILKSLQRLNFICESENKRLAAALSYYYTAKRLIEAGNSPFEFMAEVVLNYCKVLEILFVYRDDKSMDDVREALPDFGYSNDEIEEKFIPIIILRNYFDVGHVSIQTFKQEQLDVLHEIVASSEHYFNELLKRVIDKVQDGSYKPKRNSDRKPDQKKMRKINDLVRMHEKKKLTAKKKLKKSEYKSSTLA